MGTLQFHLCLLLCSLIIHFQVPSKVIFKSKLAYLYRSGVCLSLKKGKSKNFMFALNTLDPLLCK